MDWVSTATMAAAVRFPQSAELHQKRVGKGIFTDARHVERQAKFM